MDQKEIMSIIKSSTSNLKLEYENVSGLSREDFEKLLSSVLEEIFSSKSFQDSIYIAVKKENAKWQPKRFT